MHYRTTQELASWALGESPSRASPSHVFHSASFSDTDIDERLKPIPAPTESQQGEPRDSIDSRDSSRPEAIQEVSEPVSPEDRQEEEDEHSAQPVSGLTNLIHGSPPKRSGDHLTSGSRSSDTEVDRHSAPSVVIDDLEADEVTETTALLPSARPQGPSYSLYKASAPIHRPWTPMKGRWGILQHHLRDFRKQASHPREWDMRRAANAAVGALAAVFLGLLLNVLDALSYGMILFPLGEEIFEKTGPDGISMFYVSCIVSQLVYSLGGSRFKGGVGSEMIEVVPFFHKMAYLILNHVGDEDPRSVMATVITSYAASSILTGIIFLLLGALRLGDLVSFFPRSILLGCIGGVGVFLFLTGIEVSAGLDSNMEWSLETLERLFYPATLLLWAIPLLLSVLLITVRRFLTHPVVMPAFFIAIIAIFYTVFACLPNVSLDDLQNNGWVFAAPQAGIPFWNFYTYYDFKAVNWGALAQTIPTMFALSFFGIIHVPINVPALGIAVQEDDVNINRELFGHGISNTLSGLAGSIQNYLVFANSRLFIQNGGNSRWAGILLAIGTTGIWVAGPAMIGYIPIMVVGTLIFLLGVEMIQEALWDTFGKLHRMEYLMIVAITLVMGFYDFVVGIVLGIILACLIFVIQTSRISAIRATYSGKIAESTVRRHPLHRRFLHQVGSQIKVTKLAGYLFFGTIVAVEKQIRELIDEEAFSQQPIRYLILDFKSVSGMDFSAAEAFVRMNRILRSKDVEMVLSGVSMTSEVGKSLLMVGFLEEDEEENAPPPRLFEDLNQALEACENELLLAFKLRSEQLAQQKGQPAISMTIPQLPSPTPNNLDTLFASPRRNHIQEAATTTLKEHDLTAPTKWQNFAQPLPLIMQAFKDLTDRDLDFWHRCVRYFQRREFPAGTVLYSRGDEPDGFYLLEDGILRAEYELEQGSYYESIVAGTTCGELPFFSETDRTGTVVAEKDCVAWLLSKDKWRQMEEDMPDLAREMLKVGLRLTRERMEAITS
jgi:sulfate permease, SulP family